MSVYINRMSVVLGVFLALIVLCGCSQSFTARQYPSFYDPNLHTVAVVPFQNDTTSSGAGVMMADSLAAALHANGTYKIVPPRQLLLLERQKKLQSLSRTDYQKNAEDFRELGGIQAFVVGKVLRDSTIAATYPAGYWYAPYYSMSYTSGSRARYELVDEDEGDEEGEEGEEEGFDDDFGDDFYDFYGPYYPYVYWPQYSTRAHVSLEASLVRVSDGAVLYTTSVPVQGRAELGGSRRVPPASAALDAMNWVAFKLVRDIAVVPVKVKVNPRADIKTAVGEENGQWKFSNRFSPAVNQMYVVMHLPPDVSRDTFRLTITPRGHLEKVIVTKDITWPSDRSMDAVQFSPREIANRVGEGSYTVRLYAMGEPVMKHNFTIK